MTLTDKQRIVLTVLAEYVEAPTTRRLADRLESPAARREYWSYDKAHAALKRLEKRDLVARDSRRPVRWTITSVGRAALATD